MESTVPFTAFWRINTRERMRRLNVWLTTSVAIASPTASTRPISSSTRISSRERSNRSSMRPISNARSSRSSKVHSALEFWCCSSYSPLASFAVWFAASAAKFAKHYQLKNPQQYFFYGASKTKMLKKLEQLPKTHQKNISFCWQLSVK